MSAFFDHYRKIQPYLQGKSVYEQVEYLMAEEKRKEVDPYINCILCGICFGTCPAFEKDSEFLGPAMRAARLIAFLSIRGIEGTKKS